MNSIEFLNQLVQSVNSLNGFVFTLRSDFDTMEKNLASVKKSVSGLDQKTQSVDEYDEYNKRNEEQVQLIFSNLDKTKSMVEEMQQKLSTVEELYKKVSVDGELDYFKTVSKETSEKLKNLEIAYTLKFNTLERTIKSIPKPITKDDVQSMIDQSISQLLEGLRPAVVEPTLETFKDNQDQVLSIPIEQIDSSNVHETLLDTSSEQTQELEPESPVEVVIQSIEPVSVSETKPKRKKPTKKTK